VALPLKYNFRNLMVRKSTTFTTIFSIGLTIAVFLTVMALARGIDLTLATSGEPLNLIILRNGSTVEILSDITRDHLNTLRFLDGVARDNDQPIISPELITLMYRARKGQSQGGNITIRGVGAMSTKLRSGFQLTQGEMFQTGTTEAIVSRRIAERFQGLEIGDKFRVQGTDYSVVGLFDAGGKAFESEIWVDINALQGTMKRESFTSVLVRVKDEASMSTLAKRISDDQRLQLKAVAEQRFYEDQQGVASGLLKGLGAFISLIMAIGASFAGTNTMYQAVSNRTREIGTLRVLGFSQLSILLTFILESVALAIAGTCVGILLSLPLNLVSTGTGNFLTFSEIAFNFRVTPDLMLIALVFGVGIGLFGALLPALRASRLKIVDALRSS
jgi:putative ABC transport system permease protein